jgi:hypothetical protein
MKIGASDSGGGSGDQGNTTIKEEMVTVVMYEHATFVQCA